MKTLSENANCHSEDCCDFQLTPELVLLVWADERESCIGN